MNTQDIINTLPDQAKRSVLFSLVGSLNASVVGTSASIASRLTKDDYDFRELEPREVVALMNDPDMSGGALITARRTARVAQNLRDQLIALSNNDEDGALSATIDFMTKPSARKLDTKLLAATLEAAGLKDIDPAHFQAMQSMNDAQRAERLAQQRGHIEWLIEHVIVGRGYEDEGTTIDDETGREDIEDLPEEQRERLYDKMIQALNKARDTTVLGVMNRDRRYTLGDLPLISAALADAETLH
jgi:hypothetical protein